jgi:hypothetical protein
MLVYQRVDYTKFHFASGKCSANILFFACFWKICPSLPIRGQVYSHLTTDPRHIATSHGHMGLNLKCKMFGGCYTPINPKDFEITKVVWFFIFIFHDLSVESSLLHQGYKVDSVDMSPRHARLVQVRVAGLALAGIQL